MTKKFNINQNGDIVINNNEYILIDKNVLYNVITLNNVLSDDDLNKPLIDLDTDETYTLENIIKLLSESTINPLK